jgi:hypothetical protein
MTPLLSATVSTQLRSANHRVQKFSPEGIYLMTFGRRGQGPGEFYNPDSIDIDAQGVLYVMDALQSRIQTMTPTGAGDRTIRLADDSMQKVRCLKSGTCPDDQGVRRTHREIRVALRKHYP